MKYIFQLSFIFLLFLNVTHARECPEITEGSSLEGIVEAQECVKENLKKIESVLSRYKEYEVNIHKSLQDIIDGGARCIEQELLQKDIKNSNAQGKIDRFINGCRVFQKEKLKRFVKATETFSKVTEKVQDAAKLYEATKAFNKTIEDLKKLKEGDKK